MIEWIRFGLCALLILSGLFVLLVSVSGVHKFKFALNRIHFAGITDTMGVFLIITGLVVAAGVGYTALKLLAILFFLWFSSPVSSHFLARLEYDTDTTLSEHCVNLNEQEDEQ